MLGDLWIGLVAMLPRTDVTRESLSAEDELRDKVARQRCTVCTCDSCLNLALNQWLKYKFGAQEL